MDCRQIITAGCTDMMNAPASQPEQVLPLPTPIKHVNKQAGLAPSALWPSGVFVEHAGGYEGDGLLRCQEDWEGFRKCLANVRARTVAQGVPICLGNGWKGTGVWQQIECALIEIVCPRHVPDVDSHWFANREPQAPGATSKQECLPFSVTTEKWNWVWGGQVHIKSERE